MSPEEGKYISVPRARARLPVSRSKFYRLLENGSIEGVRIPGVGRGATWLVDAEGLERFVEACRRDTAVRVAAKGGRRTGKPVLSSGEFLRRRKEAARA